MPSPKVSILVPVYGVERYIEKCARSLFEQTFGDIEYVFVNDRTKDRSIEVLRSVLEQYPERVPQVRIVEHEKNLGLAGARNTAVALARGEYVLHVDSDDYLEPEAVERLVRVAEAEEADIVAADMYWQFQAYSVHFKHIFCADKQEYLKILLSKQTSANVCGKLIHKKLYTDHHIEIPLGLNYGEDYCVYPRLVYFSRKTAYLPFPVYHYVQYNAGAYTRTSMEKNTDAIVRVISTLEDFFREQKIYDDLKESFDTAKLKVKAAALFLLSGVPQKRFAQLYPGIPLEQYKNRISRREYRVLHLARKKAFFAIKLYRTLYLSGGKIKRTIKNRF